MDHELTPPPRYDGPSLNKQQNQQPQLPTQVPTVQRKFNDIIKFYQ